MSSKKAKYALWKRFGGERPKDVDGQLASRTDYYKVQLRKLVKGIFKVECPLEWDIDYFLNNVVYDGFNIITDSEVGVIPVTGSLTGINYMNNPIEAIIKVPILPQMKRTIGVDCELFYLERTYTKSYFNFRRIIDVYSEKFASADATIDVNLMVSRLGYIIEAESKAQAETIKNIIRKITEGEPVVVYKNETLKPDGVKPFFGNVKQMYIANDVQDTKRTIMNEFLTLLGINNANSDKRERLITNEVNANNIELMANVSHWKEVTKRQCEKINKMFPDINFNVEFQFDQSKYMETEVANDVRQPSGTVADEPSK